MLEPPYLITTPRMPTALSLQSRSHKHQKKHSQLRRHLREPGKRQLGHFAGKSLPRQEFLPKILLPHLAHSNSNNRKRRTILTTIRRQFSGIKHASCDTSPHMTMNSGILGAWNTQHIMPSLYALLWTPRSLNFTIPNPDVPVSSLIFELAHHLWDSQGCQL